MNKIEIEFNNLIGEMTDEQFWKFVSSWLNEDFVLDIMNNWEDEVKEEAIKEIKEIMKK